MLIGKSSPKQLRIRNLNTEQCPNCQKFNSLKITVFITYFQVFYFPILPNSKQGQIECSNCKHVLSRHEATPSIVDQYEQEKNQIKKPIWYYGFFFLAVIFFCGMVYFLKLTKEWEREFQANPLPGDTYMYKNEFDHYTVFKVTDVFEDSLLILHNRFESTSSTDIFSTLDQPKKYLQDTFVIHRDSVDLMYEQGEILSIRRK